MARLFTYGSLVAQSPGSRAPQLASLRGFQRVWNVAMDNSQDLPGYKYYRRASDGVRPDVVVAFLNLAPCGGASVNGALLSVSDHQLQVLDERERNYARREVSSAISKGRDETVWAYLGTAAAQARFNAGPAVISREYLERVQAAFVSLGEGELARFKASTAPPSCAVVELQRIDLPAA